MHFSQAQYFASVAWWIIGQKLKKKKGGGFIITFSEVLSYICNLYNSMNIICATQLSQNIIYGFLLGVWKCTSEADSRVAPPRCLLTLYSGWNIKDANVSTKPGVILRRDPNKSDETRESRSFSKAASIVNAGWAFLPWNANGRVSLLFICSETN